MALKKSIALKNLEGHKRTFYMDEHGGYRHEYVDFYPAVMVEKVIEDLYNQVYEERKKWSSLSDHFHSKRRQLRQERRNAIAEVERLREENAMLKSQVLQRNGIAVGDYPNPGESLSHDGGMHNAN